MSEGKNVWLYKVSISVLGKEGYNGLSFLLPFRVKVKVLGGGGVMGHWEHPRWSRQRWGSGLSGGGRSLLGWAEGVAMWGHLALREACPGVTGGGRSQPSACEVGGEARAWRGGEGTEGFAQPFQEL